MTTGLILPLPHFPPIPTCPQYCSAQTLLPRLSRIPSPSTGEGQGGGEERWSLSHRLPPPPPPPPPPRGSARVGVRSGGAHLIGYPPPHPNLPPPGGRSNSPLPHVLC